MCECIIVRYPAIDGVRTEANEIEYCPLHAAAPKLLKSSERMLDYIYATSFDESPGLEWLEVVKADIRAAKGECAE